MLQYLTDPLVYIPAFFKVLTRAGESGRSKLVPMALKPVQEQYLRERTSRDIIVKGRQMGMSTGILASNSHKIFTEPYHRMITVAHKGDSAEFLLQTVHRFYNNLPAEIKPEIDWKAASRMRFPAMDALIHIDSAQSRDIGRSESPTIVHLSEVAHWPEQSAEDLWTGMEGGSSEMSWVTMESTPRGRGGFFYNMYQEAKKGDNGFKAFFFPWWMEPDYCLPIRTLGNLTDEERLLMKHKGLSDGQVAWRRQKIAKLKDLFYQEFPENDSDCWLGGDLNVFDGPTIRKYMRNISPGRTEGEGLTIWKDSIGGRNYIMGVDAAGGHLKGDWSVCVVIDSRTCEHVATYRVREQPDLFGEAALRLARRYNNAFTAIEREAHGHTIIRIFLEHNYENLYYNRDYDVLVGVELPRPGWITSGKSKPIMIDTMKAAFRAFDFITQSENLLNEALAYQYIGSVNSDRIRAAASTGETDDELTAAMIALMVREVEPAGVQDEARYKPEVYA